MLLLNTGLSCAFLVIASLSFSQGRVVDFRPRIVNGTDVNVGERPFQVSLQIDGSHFCGGSILNENYIVTASHCVEGERPESITVVVGTVNYKKPGESRGATKIIQHEDYNPDDSYANDIALIKLDSPLTYTELIKPVPLPDSHEKIPAKSVAVVSGWGLLGGDIPFLPEHLQKAQIWIANQDYCQKVMKELGYKVTSTQICANDPSNRRGQCNGDSGGPLTVNGTLTGIVSWSYKDPYCASTKYPGVYTRVPEFIDWIKKHAE
ncbi:hypothetical protein QAD02_019767 [Eretmocerus hayati]|uniref:Uncharacterized protein n=1 Tax=Eretmocerus hayati TaxID=131215 RepID=A0ACC2PKN3_9HYME|nr:hypothetical protein QAD02_019767 [Eretmocerus hayati]